MKTSLTHWSIDDAENTYHVKRWGNGYFDIGETGDINVIPRYDQPDLKINLKEVIEEIKNEGIQLPVVIRFHDILRSQVELLNKKCKCMILFQKNSMIFLKYCHHNI